MKLKISFDKKAIGHFFLEHAEKVVFALFILAFAVIIYGAMMRREKFDKAPSVLINDCSNAQGCLKGERPEQLKLLEKTREYKKDAEKYAELSKKGISVDQYECYVALDKPLFGMKGKREQPVLYDVVDLRTSADFGAFQINPTTMEEGPGRREDAVQAARGGRLAPGGRMVVGGSVRGKCWVVLTGLVPIEQQQAEYRKVFRDAIGYRPIDDVPAYLSYYVERAEINSPADVQNPAWKTFKSQDATNQASKEWSQSQQEVVDLKYIDESLTFPLGPLQNRRWGKNVAHEPEIPALNPENENPRAGGRLDIRQIRRTPTNGLRGAQPIAQPYPATDAGADSNQPAKNKLFRFFDFSVEPGKSYIYRVRLVLKNPNYKLDAAQLKNPQFAEKEFLETTGSNQTDIVYVPEDTKIFAESVNPKATGVSGKVYLVKWMKETGQEIYKDFSIERGQVLNFFKVDGAKVVLPEAPSGATPDAQSVENTNFVTETTVVDMDGGKKIGVKDRNLTEPGEMLLMFVRGNSIVLMGRNELDDMSDVDRIKTQSEDTKGTERRGPAGRTGIDAERRAPPGRGETNEGERRLFNPGK